MENAPHTCQGFLLRLPRSLRESALQFARQDGTSLNHFIGLAVAEKIMKLEIAREVANARRWKGD